MATISSPTLAIRASVTVNDGDSSSTPALNATIVLAPGVGASQIDKVYKRTLTIVDSSTPKDIDLQALIYEGDDVATAVAKCALVIIRNKSAVQKLTVGNAASNAFSAWLGGTTPTEPVGKSGVLVRCEPVDAWAVDGTHKVIRVATDGGTNITFDFMVWCRSA